MTATDTLTRAPAGTWQLDPVHSTVGFQIEYLAGAFRGHFRDVEAKLEVGDERTVLDGAAKVASVDVKDDNLAAHLQSPDFFDAERHPELRFSADDVRIDRETVSVNGAITIKGVTKPVALAGSFVPPITDGYGNERIGLKVTTSIDRTDFGVDWNMPLPTGRPALSNEVMIGGDLFFVKEA
jgi:polyisoprenoid-binding protein YceI